MTEKEYSFYEKDFSFSYSSINLLLYHPKLFYNTYVLGQREVKDSQALIEGRLIHLLILEADKFDDNYIVSLSVFPSPSVKSIINELYYGKLKGFEKKELDDYKDEILELLEEKNLYQKLTDDKKTKVTGDEKRFAKVSEAGDSYFKHLKKAEGKEVISKDLYDKCKDASEEILLNEKVKDLIGLNDLNSLRFNEEKLECELDDYNFGLKGIIDNFVFDHDNKKIIINDVKTTSKDLVDFKDSILYYKYWIQAVIYIELVTKNAHKYTEEDVKEYNIDFNFIVVDKFNTVYPFKVSKETINSWKKDFEEILRKVSYHYTDNRFDLPYDLIHENITI